jgi:hypothetical protein
MGAAFRKQLANTGCGNIYDGGPSVLGKADMLWPKALLAKTKAQRWFEIQNSCNVAKVQYACRYSA